VRKKGAWADSAPISLFPFLSILACVIGTLVLLISGLAIAQALSQPDDQMVVRAERFGELSRQTQQLEARRLRLEDELAEASRHESELAGTRQQIAELRAKADSLDTAEQPFEEERVLLRQLSDLNAERKRLGKELARLEAQAAGVGRPLGSVVSGGSGRPDDMHPTYVEVDADRLLIHDRDPAIEVRSRDMASDPAFAAVCQRVARDPSGIVIFLIRDTGAATFARARQVAAAHNARHGKIPLLGHEPLVPGRLAVE
jgi:hypothetical protein